MQADHSRTCAAEADSAELAFGALDENEKGVVDVGARAACRRLCGDVDVYWHAPEEFGLRSEGWAFVLYILIWQGFAHDRGDG